MAINERLQRLLDHTRSSYAVLPHSEAFTSQEVAQSARVRGRQFAKVVVVRDAAGKDFMVVLPASEHVDLQILHRETGRTGFRLEDEQELSLIFPDCELGAMPPFGALYGLPMYLDPCLLKADDVFFQAGNHHEVVLMKRREYQQIAGPFLTRSCLHATADDGWELEGASAANGTGYAGP
jgi:Ala-tRNA(Pro) deacylase